MPVHELYYWIALRLTFGIGTVAYKHLLERFSSPERIFAASAEELASVEGLSRRAMEALQSFNGNREVDEEIERIERESIAVIPYTYPGYPERLRSIYDPPPYLYVRGTLPPDDRPVVAVVGSRHSSSYGRRIADEICRALASRGVAIISGMARGIDATAHQAAVACNGSTVAVLGSGVDVAYPRENEHLYRAIAETGAVVSEYPMGTEPSSYNFPARNRIISGLSDGVLVVEAQPKSGSLITARMALEQGRDVYAVPGSVYSFKSRGPHGLIRSGALLVESASDILEALSLSSSAPDDSRALSLDGDLLDLYRCLDDEPAHIDELIEKSSCPSSRVSALLLDLELGGYVKQLPGKRFVRC